MFFYKRHTYRNKYPFRGKLLFRTRGMGKVIFTGKYPSPSFSIYLYLYLSHTIICSFWVKIKLFELVIPKWLKQSSYYYFFYTFLFFIMLFKFLTAVNSTIFTLISSLFSLRFIPHCKLSKNAFLIAFLKVRLKKIVTFLVNSIKIK